MKVDYFYGAQMERVIKHLIRLFGGFQIMEGYDADGSARYRAVPCRYGDISRLSATQLTNNSENMVQSAPFMTINITQMSLSKKDLRAPMAQQYVVGQNKKDSEGVYTNELEAYYEVERFNPVPWDITFDLDVFVTNTVNKFELFEQISVLFAPSVMLQLSSNPNDSTSAAYVELKGYNHNSGRGFPQGRDYNLDMCKFTFSTQIWLSLPAKVNRAVLINQVVTNVNAATLDEMEIPNIENFDLLSTEVYTPGNHAIEIAKTSTPNVYNVTLSGKRNLDSNGAGLVYSWDKLFSYYSDNSTSATMRLLEELEAPRSISGKLIPSKTPNVATFSVDVATLPTASRTFDKYVDEARMLESLSGDVILIALLANEITVQGHVIKPNDIVTVADSKIVSSVSPVHGEVVQQMGTGTRYKYTKGLGWHDVVLSSYTPGYWRLGF